MKRAVLFFLALSLVFTVGMAPPRKQALTEVNSLKWLEMTPDKRIEWVRYTATFLKKRAKIKLEKSAQEYYDDVYAALRANPELYPSNMSAVLLDRVLISEPTLKESIESYRQGY